MRPILNPQVLHQTMAAWTRRPNSLPAFLFHRGAPRLRSRYSALAPALLRAPPPARFLRDPYRHPSTPTERRIWTQAARALGRVLKLRYAVGAGVGYGGYTVNKNIDKFKENLPDLGWLDKDANLGKLQEKINRLKLSVEEYKANREKNPGWIKRSVDWGKATARSLFGGGAAGDSDSVTLPLAPLPFLKNLDVGGNANNNAAAATGSASADERGRKELESAVRAELEPRLKESLRREMEPAIANEVEEKLEPLLRLQLEQEILLQLKAKMEEELKDERVRVADEIERNWKESVEKAFEEEIVQREHKKMVEIMKHVEDDKTNLVKLELDLQRANARLEMEREKAVSLEAESEMQEARRVDLAERLMDANAKVASLQSEILDISAKFQKEIERLENENRELRRQIILKEQKNAAASKMKKSLIDMYSEVLDELTIYDAGYNTMFFPTNK